MRRPSPSLPALWLSAACALASCSKESLSPATLTLTPGQETDAFTRDPKPTRLSITMRSADASTPLLDGPWPSDGVALPDMDLGNSYAFDVAARDESGAVVLRGGSPFIAASEISGTEMPVLVGRVGEWSRPTSGLSSPLTSPVATLVLGRYVFAASGSTAELYDLARLRPLTSNTPLPRAPRSIATSDGYTLLLVDDSGASKIDTSSGALTDPGVTFAPLVSGGPTIVAEDGTAFIVGAGRTSGAATRAVLRMLPDGSITEIDLATPRLRAAAAWVPGTGLLVVGGEGTPGAELLPSGSTGFVAFSGEVPAVAGAALVAPRKGEALLVGGQDAGGATPPVRRLRLGCVSSCEAVSEAAAGPEGGLADATGFRLSDGHALAVGVGEGGAMTAVYLEDDGQKAALRPAAPKGKLAGAAAVFAGDGYVVLLGGNNDGQPTLDVQLFTPP